MSNYKIKSKNLIIECGYDRPMDYVFVQLIKENEYLYSNINDCEIDFTCQTDFTYFDEKLKEFQVEIPEEFKVKVLKDRAEFLDSLEIIPLQIYSSIESSEKEDKCSFTILIGQHINKNSYAILKKEYFKSKSDALTRINQINGSFVDDIDDI